MYLQRRKHYPGVKRMGGLLKRQPVDNDPLLDEIKEAVEKAPLNRSPSSGEVKLVESQSDQSKTEKHGGIKLETPKDQLNEVIGEVDNI